MTPPFETILTYASLAPSFYNTQPWKFKTEGHFLKLYPDFNRSLPVTDPYNDALYISLGCALENLVIAANHYGYDANVMYDLYSEKENIVVHLFETKEKKYEDLFTSIEKRHVNHQLYDGEDIPYEDLGYLLKRASEDKINIKLITSQTNIEEINTLVKEAGFLLFNNPLFKKELLHWTRFNNKTAQQTKDGLRVNFIGSFCFTTSVGNFIYSKAITPEKEVKKTERLINSSSALVAFTAIKNKKENLVQLGRSFERFALAATACNMNYSHINIPGDEIKVREQLKQILNLNKEEDPMLLIRIGYAVKNVTGTYRRPVHELMMDEQN